MKIILDDKDDNNEDDNNDTINSKSKNLGKDNKIKTL